MPRMAQKLAGTFDRRLSRPDIMEIRVRRNSLGGTQMYKISNTPTPTEVRDFPRASIHSSSSGKSHHLKSIEVVDGEVGLRYDQSEEILVSTDSEHEDIIDIVQQANMDGLQHLKSKNRCTKMTWRIILIIFICLALIQICSQIQLYRKNPVATNIDAEYPSTISFPTVAICNNNQFRLTYITSARLLNRRANKVRGGLQSVSKNSSSVFDKVLQKSWDMDAVKFLREAAHWKSRMILGCTWPNGTACRLSDFRAVWTMTGLCWAINTDQYNPLQVTGSGAGHGLKLLLNVESYERVEACTAHFRTKSLPGLKILIYNQTDIPESSLNGVNVPPGYSMDIPFKMQHRHKLPGASCNEETSTNIEAANNDFFGENNIRTCAIKKYVTLIEEKCGCSLRRAFANPKSDPRFPFCNVDQYFGCVQGAIKQVRESGETARCLPPCESIDYTAWQDMNRLPQHIMPPVIDDEEEEDEHEVEEEDIDDEVFVESGKTKGYQRTHEEEAELFVCHESDQLDEKKVNRIKREAHRAYEKQSRYQEDIHLRTKRLIAKVVIAKNRLIARDWGWHNEEFISVFDRLNESCSCFGKLKENHPEISTVLSNPPTVGEEKRAQQIHFLIDQRSYERDPHRYKTIGDIKGRYGDRVESGSVDVETLLKNIQLVLEVSEKMWKLFEENNYHTKFTADMSRMDRIFELMEQYDHGKLQRRAWAEKMQSRQMRHFFEEEFYDNWYQPIHNDLQQHLVKTILDLEESSWPKVDDLVKNKTAAKIGAVIFFGGASKENMTNFDKFLTDIHHCVSSQMRNTSQDMLNDFKRRYKELQAAYNNVFKKELPNYLENFEFDTKFENENFAMVNIYLHKMHLEHWRQDTTYTFWSLACDIGGALGLFLGASLLTLIELVYLCFHYKLMHKVKQHRWVRRFYKQTEKKPSKSERKTSKTMNNTMKRKDRLSYTPIDIHDLLDHSLIEQVKTPGQSNEELEKKTSVWSNPMLESPTSDERKKKKSRELEDDHSYPTMEDIQNFAIDPSTKLPKQFSTITEIDTPPEFAEAVRDSDDCGYSSIDRENSRPTIDEQSSSPERVRRPIIKLSVTPPEQQNSPNHTPPHSAEPPQSLYPEAYDQPSISRLPEITRTSPQSSGSTPRQRSVEPLLGDSHYESAEEDERILHYPDHSQPPTYDYLHEPQSSSDSKSESNSDGNNRLFQKKSRKESIV